MFSKKGEHRKFLNSKDFDTLLLGAKNKLSAPGVSLLGIFTSLALAVLLFSCGKNAAQKSNLPQRQVHKLIFSFGRLNLLTVKNSNFTEIRFGAESADTAPQVSGSNLSTPNFVVSSFSAPEQAIQTFDSPSYLAVYKPIETLFAPGGNCNIEQALSDYILAVTTFAERLSKSSKATGQREGGGSVKAEVNQSEFSSLNYANTIPSAYFCALSTALSCVAQELNQLDYSDLNLESASAKAAAQETNLKSTLENCLGSLQGFVALSKT